MLYISSSYVMQQLIALVVEMSDSVICIRAEKPSGAQHAISIAAMLLCFDSCMKLFYSSTSWTSSTWLSMQSPHGTRIDEIAKWP